MISDQVESTGLYGALGKRIAAGLALLNEDSVRDAAPGRHEVDGDNLFYIVLEYETQPVEEGVLEIHRKYIDIQCVVSGTECMGYALLEGHKEETPYNGEKDLAFYKYDPSMSRLTLKEGMFAMFWPNEPHMPCRTAEKTERVKKIVIKVRVE